MEDDADDQMLLSLVCKKAGLKSFSFADNGKRAVELLKPRIENKTSIEPPLIFLDLNMPEMTGFEFLTWLRKEIGAHSVPVLILSTSENPHDMQAAYALGANAYLVKSNGLAELGKMISAAHEFWTRYCRVPTL